MPDPRWADQFNRAAREAPPILLYGECTVAPGKNGAPNMLGLGSPFRGPLLLDEVRFQITRTDTGAPNLKLLPGKAGGGALRAKFSLGRMEVSHGFVPVWLYCSPIQDFYEMQFDTYAGGGDDDTWNFEFYRWKLPQPLFIDAGQQLMVDFARPLAAPLDSTGDMKVEVTYSCRALPVSIRKPEEIHVPYVACFTPSFDPDHTQTRISDELDLVNVFSHPLFVQKLTGRIYDPTSVDTIYLQGAAGEGVALGLEPGISGAPNKLITVKMADTYGYDMVRDFTPFGQVFETSRRAFTFHQVLWQKERFVASIQGIPANVQPQIGLIGFRRELPTAF